MHSTGASAFFVVVYLHMFRGLIYGSIASRANSFGFSAAPLPGLMAEAFFGYLLPWGQMSYWGAQVIVNLFSTVPYIGDGLGTWIRGDYTISDVTLNRFFALHVAALPLVLIFLAADHLMALHEVGSNNPDGIEIKRQPDGPEDRHLPRRHLLASVLHHQGPGRNRVLPYSSFRSSFFSFPTSAAISSRRTISFPPTR